MFYAAWGVSQEDKRTYEHLSGGDCDGETLRDQCLTQRFNICDIKELK